MMARSRGGDIGLVRRAFYKLSQRNGRGALDLTALIDVRTGSRRIGMFHTPIGPRDGARQVGWNVQNSRTCTRHLSESRRLSSPQRLPMGVVWFNSVPRRAFGAVFRQPTTPHALSAERRYCQIERRLTQSLKAAEPNQCLLRSTRLGCGRAALV